MKLIKYLRSCAVCNVYFPPNSWLCNLCWKSIEREYLVSENTYRIEKTLPHCRLLDWHEDNHQIIKLFINSLKQGGPDFIFKRLGLEMFSRFLYFNLWDKKINPIFIPAPPRLNTNKDHAFEIAKALSFYFGGEVKELFIRKKSYSSQKTKSKRQRINIQIKSKKIDPFHQPIIFVDDVLTTGSTARAAFQALNKPKNFFIFTLVWRRLIQKENYSSK